MREVLSTLFAATLFAVGLSGLSLLTPAEAAEHPVAGSGLGPQAHRDYSRPVLGAAYKGSSADPERVNGTQSCVGCHEKTNPTMVSAWQHSRHAAKGVGCAGCHGDNHSRIFETKGAVSAAVCGSCHAKQLKEFDRSLHAAAMDLLKTDSRFERLSPVMAEQGCIACHKIGARSGDGSRGQCNSCHSGHAFSSAEARRPEACGVCHTGPDHAQLEMWQTSKHGQLFAAEATRSQSPTCVTCHMPGGSHDTGAGLTFGNVANGAAGESSHASVKMRTLSETDAERERAAMLKSCLPCHSSRFSSESLEAADRVKLEVDGLLREAAAIISGLKEAGLIGERQRPVKEMAKPGEKGGVTAGSAGLVPDFEGPTLIEQRFFDMVKFHHASAFKGAYHQSPLHTHNLGFLRLKQDLNFIQSEAARIRKTGSESKPQSASP